VQRTVQGIRLKYFTVMASGNNSSCEITEGLLAAVNETSEAPTRFLSSARYLLPNWLPVVVSLIVMGVGSFANAAVLAVLVSARRHFGSCVHTLIANQSAMDLLACAFGFCSRALTFTGAYKYNGNAILDGAICVILEGTALSGTCATAGKLGLVVITLERYFKVVHAIAHRKYYRNWMTKVGVALPWIGGASFSLFPVMGTTRVANGRCMRLHFWPIEGMLEVSTFTFSCC